ncbi:MAG: ATP-binding cassette domain-containing protein [Bacteroidetes bacterium]|nr:MAG: ATP-binding cassette domain-containing protein [Bacteroidota bacterium]
MGYILQAENIDKIYDKHQALTDVSIRVPRQGIFGLLGPNGAGKTTLIRIINQIIAPDNGRIIFDGEKLNSRHIKKIGYLPEERGLYKKMKVGEQALYLAQLKNVNGREAKVLLKDWFEKFDLIPWWNRKVEELSKGMQQKLQFIITILHKPDLLIFDEPFSGFDPINVNLLKEEILKLKEQGTSIIFSTHNMSSVEELCDNIALINKSKKILDGNLDEIKQSHSNQIFSLQVDNLSKPLENILQPVAALIKQENGSDGFIKAKVKLEKGYNANDLIKHILPNVRFHSFQEELPSMNDIFIKTVTGKYPHEMKKEDLKIHLQMDTE